MWFCIAKGKERSCCGPVYLREMKGAVVSCIAKGEDAPLFTCGCGKQGCLDEYLSGRGFEQLYKHYYKDEKSAVEIIELYNEGSAIETEFVDMFMELVSICYANLFSILDPNVVVLGGGL